MKRWVLFAVVLFGMALLGNWLWDELSPNQSGPLAEVTWKYNGKPYTVTVRLEDEQGQPLVASLITVYTDDDDFDFTTNLQGQATVVCTGRVLFGIQVQHYTVFSKAMARITGSPSLAQGIDFKIVAKRSDLLAPRGGYDQEKFQSETSKALQNLDELLPDEEESTEIPQLTPPNHTPQPPPEGAGQQ